MLDPAFAFAPRTVQPPISDPIYLHDCHDCIYLGDTEDTSGVPFDLYVCLLEFPTSQDFWVSSDPYYIARYGDGDNDYYSSPSPSTATPAVEALLTAYHLHQVRLDQSMNNHPSSSLTTSPTQ